MLTDSYGSFLAEFHHLRSGNHRTGIYYPRKEPRIIFTFRILDRHIPAMGLFTSVELSIGVDLASCLVFCSVPTDTAHPGDDLSLCHGCSANNELNPV